MGDRVFLGKIHKVIAGPNPKDGIAHVVGKPVDSSHPNIVVSSIVLDEYLYDKHGQVSCVVYVKDTSKIAVAGLIETPYKTFIGVGLTLCSDL